MSTDTGTGTEPGMLEAVRKLAATELDYHGPLALESRLIEDLDLDSIRLLTLAVAVEDHFGICLDEEEDASLQTVGDLVALVQAKTAGAARGKGGADAGDPKDGDPKDSDSVEGNGAGHG